MNERNILAELDSPFVTKLVYVMMCALQLLLGWACCGYASGSSFSLWQHACVSSLIRPWHALFLMTDMHSKTSNTCTSSCHSAVVEICVGTLIACQVLLRHPSVVQLMRVPQHCTVHAY